MASENSLGVLQTYSKPMEIDCGDWTGKPHPLLIDHIVENVLRHMITDQDDESALNARLVCHLWDRISTKVLRYDSNRTIYFGKYFRSPEDLLNFIQYLHVSTSAVHFPVGKFYLCEDIFKSGNKHIVKAFLINCATLLTSLTVRLDNESDLKVDEINFDEVTLSSLKSLTVDDRRLVNEGNIESQTILECLVKSSPNLQRLTVIHPPSSMFDEADLISIQRHSSERNVAEMLVAHCPHHLNYLNLDIKLNDKVLVTLSQLPVKLSELQLSLRESVFTKESLHQLLLSQKDTLHRLRFSSMGTKAHFEIHFPSFSKLTLLELHSWDSLIQGVTFSMFTYSQFFPSLKSLVFNTWAENPSWSQFFPAAYYGTVQSVTSLKLPQNFMVPAMIQNLSWLYPNLKRLDLHYSKDTSVIIQRVFQFFGDNLEELRIGDSLPREKFDVCLDSLFTGLPESVCEKIWWNKCFDPDPKRNLLLQLRNRPSLLKLKKLRKLDIEDMLRHETYVTDVTGYLVLLQMPNLCYLNMGRSQIDDECLGHLARKYPTNMLRELQVPKPPSKMTSRGNMVKTSMSAYYCSSMDLFNNCVIS